ncbi:MAG: hypothetical protein JRJ69_15495, partial [Deltaproteobacteria bacterium]|nr:hypothetical protein [Deltaproteobacteria bacterium]
YKEEMRAAGRKAAGDESFANVMMTFFNIDQPEMAEIKAAVEAGDAGWSSSPTLQDGLVINRFSME